MKKNYYLISFGLILVSLVSSYFGTKTNAQQVSAQQSGKSELEYQVSAVLYMQKAAEYRALCLQAFNWAKTTLDIDHKNKKKLPKAERKKPRAVVVDIDETMLDNSPAQAYGIKNNVGFNLDNWYKWGEMRKAKAIPGAVDFANYAKAQGVRIFYISNRDAVQKEATIDNLKAVGFPDISAENILLRDKVSNKDERRALVAQKYRTVIFLGDNLNDFTSLFEKKSVEERFTEVEKAKKLFGTKFIILPNAMYGDWENAIYEYQRLTEAQKAEKRVEALELP